MCGDMSAIESPRPDCSRAGNCASGRSNRRAHRAISLLADKAGSESARSDLKSLDPRSARSHGLQLLVLAAMRHVDGVGNARHWLEADETGVRALRRVDDERPEVWADRDVKPLGFA